jgi:hypothetical protein
MGYAEIREAADRRLYKEMSNATQRDEACRIAEAIWSNSKVADILDYERRDLSAGICKAKAAIERTILDLILQRDAS